MPSPCGLPSRGRALLWCETMHEHPKSPFRKMCCLLSAMIQGGSYFRFQPTMLPLACVWKRSAETKIVPIYAASPKDI